MLITLVIMRRMSRVPEVIQGKQESRKQSPRRQRGVRMNFQSTVATGEPLNLLIMLMANNGFKLLKRKYIIPDSELMETIEDLK